MSAPHYFLRNKKTRKMGMWVSKKEPAWIKKKEVKKELQFSDLQNRGKKLWRGDVTVASDIY